MSGQNKDFYVWTMAECIKSTYEWWGIDMMSMFDNIEKDFPNATDKDSIIAAFSSLPNLASQRVNAKFK